jgi:hypothetical protein
LVEFRYVVLREGDVILVREQLSTDARTRQLGSELEQFIGTVPKPVIIRNIVEELLRIQRPSQEQSKISVSGLDDVRDLIHGLSAVKSIFVGQPVFDAVRERYSVAKSLCDTR